MGIKYASSIAATENENGFDGTMMGSHLRDWDDIKGMPLYCPYHQAYGYVQEP